MKTISNINLAKVRHAIEKGIEAAKYALEMSPPGFALFEDNFKAQLALEEALPYTRAETLPDYLKGSPGEIARGLQLRFDGQGINGAAFVVSSLLLLPTAKSYTVLMLLTGNDERIRVALMGEANARAAMDGELSDLEKAR